MVQVGSIIGKLTAGEERAIQADVDAWLIRRAIEKKIATSPEDLVVRDLLPGTDLNGLSGEVWAQSISAFSYNMNYSGKNPDTKIFAIYGGKNKAATPRTTGLKFKLGAGGAKIKEEINIEHANLEDNTAWYLKNPIKYEDDETFVIEFYGDSSGTDGVILLGRVVEPKGERIA